MSADPTGGAYRQAKLGDDLSHAVYRQSSRGWEPWVPMEPLGWQDARPRWMQRLTAVIGRWRR